MDSKDDEGYSIYEDTSWASGNKDHEKLLVNLEVIIIHKQMEEGLKEWDECHVSSVDMRKKLAETQNSEEKGEEETTRKTQILKCSCMRTMSRRNKKTDNKKNKETAKSQNHLLRAKCMKLLSGQGPISTLTLWNPMTCSQTHSSASPR